LVTFKKIQKIIFCLPLHGPDEIKSRFSRKRPATLLNGRTQPGGCGYQLFHCVVLGDERTIHDDARQREEPKVEGKVTHILDADLLINLDDGRLWVWVIST
jgi:hypothetical protein